MVLLSDLNGVEFSPVFGAEAARQRSDSRAYSYCLTSAFCPYLAARVSALAPMPSTNSRISKRSGRNRGLNDPSNNQSNAVNACFGPRRNRLGEPHSLKMHRSAIIERECR
jgi:hypothetical protein